ncbi:MAG TPA: hypothetical protein H9687_00705 [Firmicutes bacterium]|nr:hypothetical protein [Bacillota bacterium]
MVGQFFPNLWPFQNAWHCFFLSFVILSEDCHHEKKQPLPNWLHSKGLFLAALLPYPKDKKTGLGGRYLLIKIELEKGKLHQMPYDPPKDKNKTKTPSPLGSKQWAENSSVWQMVIIKWMS